MNIIGNSCVSAFISKYCLHQEYNNPFCWCKISFPSMFNLIAHYDTINFHNVSFTKHNNYYIATIDNQVEVHYIHYIEDNSIDSTIFEKSNVKSPNILEYVQDKYFLRLKKMTETPVFLLAAGYWQEYYTDDTQIQKLIDLQSPYTIIVCMPNGPNNRLCSNGNVKIHNHSMPMGVDGIHRKLASYISNYYWGVTDEATDQIINLS